jgi:hypothetical protein
MTELDEKYPVGTRIVILDVDGMIYHGLPIKTGHPEHVGKHGTLVSWQDGIPLLKLDDGNEVEGCECWWMSEEEWTE